MLPAQGYRCPVVRRAQGQQATPEAYFATALALLAEDGYAALRLGALCRRLGVTTGSFYHHFDGWSGFVRGLLDHWEADQTGRLVALTNADRDAHERVRVLKQLAVGLPHAAEAAIRIWSGVDPAVRHAQQRVDALRTAALRDVVAGVVGDDAAADRLAVLGMSILVGWQQTRAPWPAGELQELLTAYEETILQHAPPSGGR